MKLVRLLLIPAVVILAGCASQQETVSTISGYILPSSSLVPEEKLSVEIKLQDVSKMDVAATTISETRFEGIPYWPLPYKLSYETAALDYRLTYALQVRVSTLGGTLLAINDIQHQYSLSSDSSDFDVLVKPLERNPPILSRHDVDCAGQSYTVEVYEAFLSRYNKDSLTRQLFPRIISASGSKYKRENEIFWTRGNEEMIYQMEGSKVDCIVGPG